MTEPPIVVIYARPTPSRSRVNRPLADALAALPQVQVRDLYRSYVDYDVDVVAEQRVLSVSDTIVLQFPVRWYSVPALLKLWLDEVLEPGWAYGPGGTALRGKSLLAVVSTGGTADAYGPDGTHGHPIGDFLLPLEQSALLCGMNWLPPVVLHDANNADAQALAEHIAHVCGRLAPAPRRRGGRHESARLPDCAAGVPGQDDGPLFVLHIPLFMINWLCP